MSLAPRLTVITVAYNAEASIEQTVLSVAAQSAPGIEYLVIDGASGDGTIEILRRHSRDIAQWISEPDQGIYDAMNKGVAMAHGEWILFLNADDYFSDANSAQRLLAAADSSVSIVAGRTLMKYADGERIFRPSRRFGLMLQLPFMHPSAMVRRSVFEACGSFDRRYSLAADCDFFLRLIARGHRHLCIDDVISVMRHGGASTRGYVRGRLEYMAAYLRNMHDPVGACAGFALSMLMKLKAKFR